MSLAKTPYLLTTFGETEMNILLLLREKLSRMTMGVKAIAILAAALIVYNQDIIMVSGEAIRYEPTSFIILIPFLISYLIYRKRKVLAAAMSFGETSTATRADAKEEIIGGLLFVLAFLLYWNGSYTFYPLQYHLISLPLFLAGCLLIVFNKKTLKTLMFAVALLFFIIPLPVEALLAAGATLSTITSQAVYTTLKSIGLPITLVTEYGAPIIVLQRPDNSPFFVTIDVACSGIYSVMTFSIFALFIAYIVRGRTWKKPVMFLIGFPLIYALNIVRIIVIALIGYQFGSEIGMRVFELFGGWILILAGSFVFLLTVEKMFKTKIFVKDVKTSQCKHHLHDLMKAQFLCLSCGRLLGNRIRRFTKRDWYKIFILLSCSILVLFMQVPIFSLGETMQVSILYPGGEKTSPDILPDVQGHKVVFAYRDREFERATGRDVALLYVYIPRNTEQITTWVSIEIGDSLSELHGWEYCLYALRLELGLQPRVNQLDLADVQLLQDPPVVGRFFAFQYAGSNLTQAVLYWYEKVLFDMGSTFEERYVKTSLITIITPEDCMKAKSLLAPLGQEIVNKWQYTKSQSWIAPIVPEYGKTLMMTTVFCLGSVLALQAIQTRRKRRSNLVAFERLTSEREKLVLKAVYESDKTGKSTLDKIAATYEKLTEEQIELDLLFETLSKAEKAGLVKRQLTSQEDEPILIWKSQMPFQQAD